MRDKSDLYYECHVTLEPDDGKDRNWYLKTISEKHNFRVATFEMSKNGEEAEWFTSARDESYSSICIRAKQFTDALKKARFTVLRCKVEDTLLDTKHQPDDWGFLGGPIRETPF